MVAMVVDRDLSHVQGSLGSLESNGLHLGCGEVLCGDSNLARQQGQLPQVDVGLASKLLNGSTEAWQLSLSHLQWGRGSERGQ